MSQYYYAVKEGRKCGIFNTWDECKAQVNGFSGAKYKKFELLSDAEKFVSSSSKQSVNLQMKRKPEERTDDSSFSAKRLKSDEERKTQLIGFENLPRMTEGIVYTDGACCKNGMNGSKGGIGVYWGPNHHLNVSKPLEGRQTNNRAEIMAAVIAIKQAKEIGLKKVTVRTDSKFMIRGITQWIHKWKRNGWKLSTGGSVKNREDFEQLSEARQGIDVCFEHVKGHCGIEGNEAADKLARDGVC